MLSVKLLLGHTNIFHIHKIFFSVGGTPGPVRKRANSSLALGRGNSLDNKLYSVRNENMFKRVKKFMAWEEVWQDYQFLVYFFRCFSASEKVILAQVGCT